MKIELVLHTSLLKRIASLSITLFSFITPAFAQKFTTTVSPVFSSDRAENYENTVRIGNEYLEMEVGDAKMQLAFTFKLHKTKHSVSLYRYDNNMRLLKKTELFNGEKKFGPMPTKLISINYKPYMVYCLLQEEGPAKLLVAEIDMATLNIRESKELLELDVKNVGLLKAMSFMKSLNLSLKTSPDYTKLLWFWSSGTNNSYQYTVMDYELNVLRKKIETVAQVKRITIQSSAIDNDGNVICSYRANPDKDVYLQRIAISSAQKTKTIDLIVPDVKLYQSIVVPSFKGELIHVAGTFTTDENHLKGLFYQKLNTSTGQLSKIIVTPFTTELVQHLDKKDDGGWANRKEKKFGVDRIDFEGFELEDGELALVGEFARTVTTEKNSYLISGSMLSIKFTSGIPTVGYIPKLRRSAGRTIGSSYYAHPYKNQLLIFYNDRAENAALGMMDKFKDSNKYNEVALFAAYMDASGTIQRKVLIDLSNDSYLPVAEAARRFDSNSFLIPVKKVKGLGGIADESKLLTLKVE